MTNFHSPLHNLEFFTCLLKYLLLDFSERLWLQVFCSLYIILDALWSYLYFFLQLLVDQVQNAGISSSTESINSSQTLNQILNDKLHLVLIFYDQINLLLILHDDVKTLPSLKREAVLNNICHCKRINVFSIEPETCCKGTVYYALNVFDFTR